MAGDEYFGSNDAEREIERLDRVAKQQFWTTPQNREIHLTIPPTVYPPREDTDVLAQVVQEYPHPGGKRFLEIGCGSGAISLFAAQLGFSVTACDINPYAVASSRNSARVNSIEIDVREGGPGPQNDGEVRQWAGDAPHDVIVWNLPYLMPEKNTQHLGPFEEAALLDTDEKGLVNRLLHHLQTSNILAEEGIVYLLVSQNERGRSARTLCLANGFAVRTITTHTFEDGECLEVLGIWRPFQLYSKSYVKEMDSTNTSLLNSDEKEGSFLQAGRQTAGHGRRGRPWSHENVAFAGSWVIHERSKAPNPGLLQLQGGLALFEAIGALTGTIDAQILKWPNDVLLSINGDLRKVGGILVEGMSQGKESRVILGIGCNISAYELEKEGYSIATLQELNTEITLSTFEPVIQAAVASWFEQKGGVKKLDSKTIIAQYNSTFINGIKSLGAPIYRSQNMSFSKTDREGRIILQDHKEMAHIIQDGEDIIWTNYAKN
jgi:biotin-[acetyl-CoA-carboxylase] ligase BirA-like protein